MGAFICMSQISRAHLKIKTLFSLCRPRCLLPCAVSNHHLNEQWHLGCSFCGFKDHVGAPLQLKMDGLCWNFCYLGIRRCFGVDLYDSNKVHVIKSHCQLGFASKGLRRCWLFGNWTGTAEQGRNGRFYSVVSHRWSCHSALQRQRVCFLLTRYVYSISVRLPPSAYLCIYTPCHSSGLMHPHTC